MTTKKISQPKEIEFQLFDTLKELKFTDKKKRKWYYHSYAPKNNKEEISKLKKLKHDLEKDFLTFLFPDDLRKKTKKSEEFNNIFPKGLINLKQSRAKNLSLFVSPKKKTPLKQTGAIDEYQKHREEATIQEAEIMGLYIINLTNSAMSYHIRDQVIPNKTHPILFYEVMNDMIADNISDFDYITNTLKKRYNLSVETMAVVFEVRRSVSKNFKEALKKQHLKPPYLIGSSALENEKFLLEGVGLVLSRSIVDEGISPNYIAMIMNDLIEYQRVSLEFFNRYGERVPNILQYHSELTSRIMNIRENGLRRRKEEKERGIPTLEQLLKTVPLIP